MTEEQAKQLVKALARELDQELGPYAAMLVGPMLALPALRVVAIADHVAERYLQVKKEVGL